MSNHEFSGKRKCLREKLSTIERGLSKRALALVLSGAAVFGLTSCAEEAKTPREAGFAVTCSDQNGANYAPDIISVQQNTPDGRKALIEFGCPVDTDMSVSGIDPTSNSSLDSDNQKDPVTNQENPATTYLVTGAAYCPASLDGKSIVDWARYSHDEAGRETFVMTFNNGCDVTEATVSK